MHFHRNRSGGSRGVGGWGGGVKGLHPLKMQKKGIKKKKIKEKERERQGEEKECELTV